jgi:hypothetical protein
MVLMRNDLVKYVKNFFQVMLTLWFIAGCAHAPGRMLWRGASPLDVEAEQALDALAQAQDKLQSVRSQGICIVSTPELIGKRKFNLTLLYRAPADISIRGFDSTGLSGQMLRLLVVDGILDVEIPETTVNVTEMLGQAPADSIARELLQPEEWGELGERKVRVLKTQKIGDALRLTLLVNKKFGLLRRVVIEGPQWKLRESELLDKHGEILARVEWQEYLEAEGARMPITFAATFPQEELSLRFSLNESKVVVNPELSTADFLAQQEESR